jgi:hypothetical protein
MFVQLGLDIRKGSKFAMTMPVELAKGSIGYIPTEEALREHGGGYETRLTSYSNAEPAAGRRTVETAVELIGQLTPGPLPQRPKAAPSQPNPSGTGPKPWHYGNVAPELS